MVETWQSAIELKRELAYYKNQLDLVTGESIRNDYVLSSIRHELNQKKEAFSVLTSLQREFTVDTPPETIFYKTLKAITTQLGMDRSLVLLPVPSGTNMFKACHWYGFPDEQVSMLRTGEVEISTEFLKPSQYILLNKSTKANETAHKLIAAFCIHYFIGVPILVDEKPVAFIVAGRQFEKLPFNQPLNKSNADTLTAIAGLISTVYQNKKMMELKLQKAEIEKQKEAIAEQRDKLEKTLHKLKTTQEQLIQSEKLASLGVLTAGIAHEIQNPLNFVNNFAEVNVELIDEMENELAAGDRENVFAIAEDIKHNLQRIVQHGKRADTIVKSMLQHSKVSKGERMLIDLNALAEEYLHLSYNELRAKDKHFSASLDTDFADHVRNVEVVPQDIARVLLNLFNNAFYAVRQKLSIIKQEEYEPKVKVSTSSNNGKLEIRVWDNGTGIPESVKNNIFQPFFTTKPTGQGTGLGLSLSYDIITKGHIGGELSVATEEGKWTEITIRLPLFDRA